MPIQSAYRIYSPEYVACHNPAYVKIYDVLEGIKPNGIFLLNSPWGLEEMENELPAEMKQIIAGKKLKFYNIDAVKLAQDVGLGGRINMIMQTAFFKLANVIPVDDAIRYLKAELAKIFEKQGEKVVRMNCEVIDKTLEHLEEVVYPASWANLDIVAKEEEDTENGMPEFVKKVMIPMNKQKGDLLPVSAFRPDGIFPVGTSKYEKRGVAINVPWYVPMRPFALYCSPMKNWPRLRQALKPQKLWERNLKDIISACRSIPLTVRDAAIARISALPKSRHWL
jgi:pyruvate-ferredoxin/flavodoxin oxidoreductase